MTTNGKIYILIFSFRVMKKSSVLAGLFTLLIVVSSLSFVNAGVNEAVIRIVPAQTNWIANGVTQYRVDIYADNTLLAESTQAVQYRLQRPQGLGNNITIVGAQYNLSSTHDFFYGVAPAANQIAPNWGSPSQIRSASSGVSGRQGLLASYWFTLPVGTPFGSYNFTLTNVNVAHDEFTPQAFRVDSVPFTISKPKPTMATGVRAIPCTPGVNC